MAENSQLSFDYDDIYPIAMIQVPEILQQDLRRINESREILEQELPTYSARQIWIAYERCGYEVAAVPNYILNGGDIQELPFHIRAKEYNDLSPCRRDAIRSMFSNANLYFYRNRPPGEEPQFGQWSEEEQIVFHDRLMLFKHFGIAEKHWGLFAVKTKRFGYTCSSYYKQNYDPEKFKDRPLPEMPDVPKEKILEWLRQEAYDYVVNAIKKAAMKNDAVIKSGNPSSGPGRVKQNLTPIPTTATSRNSSEHEESSPQIEQQTNSKTTFTLPNLPLKQESDAPSQGKEEQLSVENIKQNSVIPSKIKEKIMKSHSSSGVPSSPSSGYASDSPPPQMHSLSHSQKRIHKSTHYHKHSNAKRDIFEIDLGDNYKSLNLAYGARDDITGLPMKTPMMNRDGYVLDRSTWQQILNGKISCPDDIIIPDIQDLIELTDDNFAMLKPYLLNVIC